MSPANNAALLDGPSSIDDTTPSEIFSVERLEHFAEELAQRQQVTRTRSAGIALRGRLRSNAAVLNGAYESLTSGIRAGQAVTPAAEWLVDNYYIVDEHIQAIRRDLPAGFYKELPKLSEGPLRGYPRVYGLALNLIAHTDNRIELDTLSRFCRAYQRVQPLTIGELWAIAITLRVVLIENLSILAAGITSRMTQRAEANALADKVLPQDDNAPALKEVMRAVGVDRLRKAFAAQLFQRLRDQNAAETPTLAWLHRTLAAHNTSADEIVHSEHQRQGAVNLSVRNVITSLRLISAVDWAEFFESISLVDELLRNASAYGSFDFATHDLYRHAIEDLSRRSAHDELEVAQRALDAARDAAREAVRDADIHGCEPGYYLIGKGRRRLETELGYRIPWHQRISRLTRGAGLTGYVGFIAVLSVFMTAAFIFGLHALSATGVTAVIVTLAALLAVSDVAVTLVNLWVNHYCPARVLPALELLNGVPRELRTLVVIPVLLTSLPDVEDYIRALEVHYLATQDGDLRFALLTDWTDSDSETTEQDAVLLAAAVAGIDTLNRTHGQIEGDERFLLLHRRRVWNAAQGKWMGWERKRGKLHELNRWLRGATDTTFMTLGGAPARAPADVRFVITLDADTRLPRGAALSLIGKMAHPLNQPLIDPAQRRVVTGYGILQPRVTPALPIAHEATFFQSIFSGPSGMDPYAFAVSDVYQDLLGEGSYSGKGIYDVTAFETVLANRLGDNRLLSHDLFEGIYARSGLASDVEVIEEYPPQYAVASARQHRWTRGDWQLLPWIFARGIAMPALGRWKMLDNLRRSLTPPATLAGLALSWSAFGNVWTGFFLGSLALPVVIPFLFNLRPQLADLLRAGYYRVTGREAAQALAMVALRIVFLADQAWTMSHAIVVTLYRLSLSHRNLLQWTTTAQTRINAGSALSLYYRVMAGSIGITLGSMLLPAIDHRFLPWVAIPFVVVWLIAPAIARAVSIPTRVRDQMPLPAGERERLRVMARQTWSFFDTFVTAEQNHLPPDNFQETPNAVVANRTSPTNIGLYLLSVAAAREFGWLGTFESLDRLEATLDSLGKLETYRGHYFNWYDTHDLRALEPKYISTVDSGNLAGHLLTLQGFLLRWLTDTIHSAQYQQGLLDTLQAMRLAAARLDDGRRNYGVTPRQLDTALQALRELLLTCIAQSATPDFAVLTSQTNNIHDIAQALTDEGAADAEVPLLAWSDMLRRSVAGHRRDIECAATDADQLKMRMSALARRVNAMALRMEFGFLIEPERQLLAIGFRVADRNLDPSCYDLLASEARLASFVAIAKGDVPVRHWFRLGRLLTPVHRGSALVSWSGSMFEYLMPVLVMREPAGSVLGETARLTVRRQIEYGAARNLPWGVSESAFNARDREFTYQYSSFGIPGLGLKRGLGDEAVVAPYATALAAMFRAEAALENFERLERLGARGPYGWYDALDFTPARLPEGAEVATVRTYMAHHQGMVLTSIANVLLDDILRSCFHSNPIIQATELLLQEKTPRDSTNSAPRLHESQSAPEIRELPPALPRRFDSPHHVAPRTHVLSNGNYSVMLTAAGSGYSRWRDIAVTRWREDPTLDPWGYYVFLRDVNNGQVWSAGYQPIGKEPDHYEVLFYEDRAEIVRRDGPIVTTTEIVVSSEYDAEVRRISVTNEGRGVREIELTTYAEVVLSTPAADSAHPAFSKMFVQTEYIAESRALLATRRPREPGEQQLWAVHFSSMEGEAIGALQFETDRARFLGRGQDLRNAVSIVDARPLSNTAGTVLDPVFSLRRRVRIQPGETVRVAFWTGISSDRAHALALVDTHRDMAAFERAKTLAWTQAQVQLRYLGVDFDEAQDFQRIANRILYADASLRAAKEVLERNQLGPAALWAHGISGDLPIVLLRIDDDTDMSIVKQLLRAHEYWKLKRLAVDLVILNDRPPSYASELQQSLEAIVRAANSGGREGEAGNRGSVVVLRSDLLPDANRDLLQTAARAVFVARRGRLSDQLARLREPPPVPRRRRLSLAPRRDEAGRAAPQLEYFNGLGGFAANAREYTVILNESQFTPAPWINVIANPQFGFQVSADGAGSTWSLNAQQNQLTPWSNDPVCDAPSEAIYLRDETNGDLWSATSLPIRDPRYTYVASHGFGYTRYEHSSRGIALELLQYVPLADSVKISRLKVSNRSTDTRQLSVTHYVDLVLGNQRSRSAPYLVTQVDPTTHAMLVRNPWSIDFQPRVTFLDMGGRQQSCTGDRAEFIGRHGSLAEPAALLVGTALSNHVGGGLDPCAAMQTKLTLAAGETTELVFFLGEESSSEAAVALLERFRKADLDAVFKTVTDFWEQTLSAVQIKTPDRSMDILVNGWLLYQALVCRIWGRAGFYQSSGAYGFRDQLQDVMSLCVAAPAIAREHILRAAARQFEEGDVQHWWLPTTGQGVKTRVADDRIWLSFVVVHYMEVTGDSTILDVPIPFLQGGPLTADQHETFGAPASANPLPLYDHCIRGLDSSLAIGSHGLPLFGTGDWNDGMNRVGAGGLGESVWMGWFLYAALLRFAPVAQSRGDADRATLWLKHAFAIRQAIEREAWDGDWYRRGYFDDGTPLGSVMSDECRIDAIAQSWAVISGAAEHERAVRAMAAVNNQLVSRSEGLVQLFTPPFDRTLHDPGYIKAYPPGLRENGGQYTHAAMWTTLAFAQLGDGDRAGELFSLLNPINHGSTRAGIHRYKVEPYVVCADVYTAAPHVGRGGWTWYTGSAAWMYRTAAEGILGIKLRGNVLVVDPCIPRAWPGFEFTYKHGTSRYRVTVDNPQGVNRGVVFAALDGQELSRTACEFQLIDDGRYHFGVVTLG